MTSTHDTRKKIAARLTRGPLVLLPLTVAIVALALLAYRRGLAPVGEASSGPIFTVAQGPLLISVTESGTVKPREQVIIKNEIEGRTTILYLIPEGTRVKEDDLLVELDASQLQDAMIDQEISVQNGEAAFIQSRENLAVVKNQAQSDVDKAELALRFAGEDLQQYLGGEYPNALREHEARITLAEEEAQRAQETLKWSRVLFDEKYVAESELRADELAVEKAKLDVELATNNLTLLRQFTYKRTVAQLESDVKQAEMALERVKRKASADVVQAEVQLRAKESEFKRQTDKLAKIREQIGKARILAPREGLVVYATSARASWRGNNEPLDEGQEVRERQELIHLPTASTFLAEVKVHESNLDKIRVGLPVRLAVDALPGQEFIGRVATIAPLPDAMSMFMNPDLKLYTTEIHIEGGGDVLRTGMSCKAEILIEHYESAVHVPVQCVVRVGGEPTVFVSTSAGTAARTVETGLDNNRMIRILQGLQVGEKVLLAPPLDTATAAETAGNDEAAARLTALNAPPSVPAVAAQRAAADNEAGARTPAAAPDERRERMRERLKNMSEEEREAFKRRVRGRGSQAGRDSAEGGG